MGSERRINLLLLKYWERLRAGRAFPSENEIDPDAPELAEIWENCFVLQLRDLLNVKDYNYTYLGEEIIRAYADGSELHEENGHIISPNASQLSSHFEEVVFTRRPVVNDGEFKAISGRIVRYRQCLLPIGDEDGRVHAILGGMRFKLFDE